MEEERQTTEVETNTVQGGGTNLQRQTVATSRTLSGKVIARRVNVGGFFAQPFVGIFGSPTYGRLYLDTASIVAIIVYSLIAWGIEKAILLTSARQEV